MRHAKSDWSADFESDHDRPLNDRGVRSARIMGRVLTSVGQIPDLIVTSTAVRARSTARLATEAGVWTCDIVLDPDLYGTGADSAVQVASTVVGSDRLMLVGHQPTWSILVSVLTGQRLDMKTATVAVIEFDMESWIELPSKQGEIVASYQPKDYFGTRFDTD